MIINREYQSVILLEDVVNRRLLTIGLFSRKSIKTSKVQEILGDVDDIRILEDSTIGGNLADYLSD
jgi:hypothetical protein